MTSCNSMSSGIGVDGVGGEMHVKRAAMYEKIDILGNDQNN